jgi:uncharacterized protein DUF3551
MRALTFIALLATALLGMIQPSAAREYPWCAIYGPSTRNCGFVSFEQCQATISGIGGYCGQNPLYQGPPPRSRRQGY